MCWCNSTDCSGFPTSAGASTASTAIAAGCDLDCGSVYKNSMKEALDSGLGTTVGQDGKFTQAQTFNALISDQDMADTFLPAFRACIIEARAASVMCSCEPLHACFAL